MKLIKQSEIKQAVDILKEGGIIAFPTETVFGLGVVYDNKDSYNRLINVKRRAPDKPFTLMCSCVEDIEKYANLNDKAKCLIQNFMPGQFTIIVEGKECLPNYVKANDGYVGIRISSNKMVQKLIKEVGKPLLVPSANKAGEKPAYTSEEVFEYFPDELDGVVEGKSISNVPSTIVKVDEIVHLIRNGVVSDKEIINVLKENNLL